MASPRITTALTFKMASKFGSPGASVGMRLFASRLPPLAWMEWWRQYAAHCGMTVGRFTYGVEQFCKPGVARPESVGAFTSIASEVLITGVNHPTNWVTSNPITYLSSRGFVQEDIPDLGVRSCPVRIGSDCWVGARATLLPGVTVGHGAVIAAGAVVASDVEPYMVVGGVPAKVIRPRFTADIVARLMAIQWWDWADAQISDQIHLFKDPSRFLEAQENPRDKFNSEKRHLPDE